MTETKQVPVECPDCGDKVLIEPGESFICAGVRKAAPATEPGLQERIAQITAHRACHSAEHDPLNGKLHGYCVVCGTPWPCAYVGTPPTEPSEVERLAVCEWRHVESDDAWQSSCGEYWQFTDGGPGANNVRFCHGCGKRVKGEKP